MLYKMKDQYVAFVRNLRMVSYILNNFESSDVCQLCRYQLPQCGLLSLDSLTQTGGSLHDVSPVLLQAIQSLFHLVLGRVRSDRQVLELGDAKARVIVQLDDETLHLLVLDT